MMNGNTEKVWTGQSNTNKNTVTGQMYNWSGQPTGDNREHFSGHGDSYTGNNNYHNYHTYNGQEYHCSYPCTKQSYNPPNYSNVQQKATGQGWNGMNHMTGQSTSYSGYGQAVPPGYMRQPPPSYGGHKKALHGNDYLILSWHLKG